MLASKLGPALHAFETDGHRHIAVGIHCGVDHFMDHEVRRVALSDDLEVVDEVDDLARSDVAPFDVSASRAVKRAAVLVDAGDALGVGESLDVESPAAVSRCVDQDLHGAAERDRATRRWLVDKLRLHDVVDSRGRRLPRRSGTAGEQRLYLPPRGAFDGVDGDGDCQQSEQCAQQDSVVFLLTVNLP